MVDILGKKLHTENEPDPRKQFHIEFNLMVMLIKRTEIKKI